MITNSTTFKLIVLYFFAFFSINAQMVGADGYIVGNFVEIGIDGSGGFEGVETMISPAPVGTHMRTNSTRFGFVANPANNNWATQDGDFFTPGQPENGWGIQIGNTLLGNNAMSLTGGLEQNEIIGLLHHDKKNKAGRINFSLLKSIGIPKIDVEVPQEYFSKAFQYYSNT